MNNAVYRNTSENLRRRIDLKLVNNEKNYLKYTLKPRYMWHKLFDNSLVMIRKSNVSLKHNKPAYIRMCKIWNWVKVLKYEFNYDYINK